MAERKTILRLQGIVTDLDHPPVGLQELETSEDDLLSDLLTSSETQPEELPRRTRTSSDQGLFVTFEGGEGAGKSTQIAAAARWLQSEGFPVLTTHEPGGTPLGKTLRHLLLAEDEGHRSPAVELFLLLADRAQHVSEVIQPSLAEGLVVLCDRFNDSSLAYQGMAGYLEEAAVQHACSLATGGLKPDLTILLDLDPEVAFRRLTRPFDRMEKKGPEFHRAVRSAFLRLAAEEPDRFVVIDAARPEVEIAAEVRAALQRALQTR